MEEAIFSSEFDDENISNVIKAVQQDINLNAIDAVNDVVKVLSMLIVCPECYLLSRADNLVICKGGMTIIHLKNSKNPNSGKSIRIEIKTLYNELTQLIQIAREKTCFWLYTFGGVATFLISGWTFYKNI